uniref:Uncharacterized protein n=2 Tax=Aegilops tauschii TaxID=37682 RepID=M8C4V3_AEGTA
MTHRIIGFSSQQHLAGRLRRTKGKEEGYLENWGGAAERRAEEKERKQSQFSISEGSNSGEIIAGSPGQFSRWDGQARPRSVGAASSSQIPHFLCLWLLTAVMNSRPIVLVFLLLVLIISSQFEWKQQIGEAEASPEATRRRQQPQVVREDAVKEKIILAQEKNIQQLTELIQSLQVQLLHCRGSNSTAHGASSNQSSASYSEADRHQIIDD